MSKTKTLQQMARKAYDQRIQKDKEQSQIWLEENHERLVEAFVKAFGVPPQEIIKRYDEPVIFRHDGLAFTKRSVGFKLRTICSACHEETDTDKTIYDLVDLHKALRNVQPSWEHRQHQCIDKPAPNTEQRLLTALRDFIQSENHYMEI